MVAGTACFKVAPVNFGLLAAAVGRVHLAVVSPASVAVGASIKALKPMDTFVFGRALLSVVAIGHAVRVGGGSVLFLSFLVFFSAGCSAPRSAAASIIDLYWYWPAGGTRCFSALSARSRYCCIASSMTYCRVDFGRISAASFAARA